MLEHTTTVQCLTVAKTKEYYTLLTRVKCFIAQAQGYQV
jgi:hypothetical protein